MWSYFKFFEKSSNYFSWSSTIFAFPLVVHRGSSFHILLSPAILLFLFKVITIIMCEVVTRGFDLHFSND